MLRTQRPMLAASFMQDADNFRSKMNSLAYGNVMAKAAEDYKQVCALRACALPPACSSALHALDCIANACSSFSCAREVQTAARCHEGTTPQFPPMWSDDAFSV